MLDASGAQSNGAACKPGRTQPTRLPATPHVEPREIALHFARGVTGRTQRFSGAPNVANLREFSAVTWITRYGSGLGNCVMFSGLSDLITADKRARGVRVFRRLGRI